LIFQDGSHRVGNVLPVSGLVTVSVSEGGNLSAYPNFDEIALSMAEIKLLPVLENGRPPYWNSISSFYFDLCTVIGIGYDFTRGRISHFPIDFCMGLTTVQRDCAACDASFTIASPGLPLF